MHPDRLPSTVPSNIAVITHARAGNRIRPLSRPPPGLIPILRRCRRILIRRIVYRLTIAMRMRVVGVWRKLNLARTVSHLRIASTPVLRHAGPHINHHHPHLRQCAKHHKREHRFVLRADGHTVAVTEVRDAAAVFEEAVDVPG